MEPELHININCQSNVADCSHSIIIFSTSEPPVFTCVLNLLLSSQLLAQETLKPVPNVSWRYVTHAQLRMLCEHSFQNPQMHVSGEPQTCES